MKKILKSLVCTLFISVFVVLPTIALAQTKTTTAHPGLIERLQTVAGAGGYQTGETASVPKIIGTVIRVALSFLGVIFLGLMIMAGYNWMTANGNEEVVKKAKGTIKTAIIGLLVVLLSYAVWTFIFQKLILGV